MQSSRATLPIINRHDDPDQESDEEMSIPDAENDEESYPNIVDEKQLTVNSDLR